ncbi:MAG: poly(R)-hydroxyalkanoic acid synthase subunit PhaE [Steroidobacteraceae bacterium]
MSGPGGRAADWIQAWIEAQKAALAQWNAERPQPTSAGARSFADLFSPVLAAAQSAFGATSSKGVTDAFTFPWAGPKAAIFDGMGGIRDLPGIGPLREQQAAAQEMAAALADVERLTLEMARVMAKVHADTLDLLARRSAERANEGKPVADAKALYDLWIECGEATYARVAHGDAFCRLQADLCNAGIRFQSVERQQMERWLKLLDLPTRSEVNSLNLRIRELQRQLESAASNIPTATRTPARNAARGRKVPKPPAGRALTKRKPRKKS